VVRPNTGF